MSLATDLAAFWRLYYSGADELGTYAPQAIAGTTFVVDGAIQVAEFSSGQIRYDPNTIDGITTNFSIGVWVKLTSIPVGGSYLLTNAYSGSTYPSVQIYLFDTGVLRFQFYTSNGAGGAQTLDGPTLAVTGTWTHLAFTYDGATMTIYQDGTPAGTLSTTGSPFTNGWSISVGSYRPYASGYYFDGRMSDLCIWYRALSAAEVVSINGAGVGGMVGLLPIETNLVSYWKFDSNVLDAWGSDNGTGTGGLAYVSSMTGFTDAIDCAGTDYVSYGTPAYGTNSLTMSMWIKPDGITGVYQSIWHNRTGSYIGWSIMVDGWGAGPGPNHYLSEVSSAGGGGPYSTIRSTSAASAGSWIHFAVVIDRSSNTQRMYVNGVLQSHGSDVASISGMGSFTNSTLYTGSSAGGSIWQGEMDDVTWWTRALTPAEITAIYAAGAAASPFSSLLPYAQVEAAVLEASVIDGTGLARVDAAVLEASVIDAGGAARVDAAMLEVAVLYSSPPPAAIVPDIAGAPLVPATFDGSASVSVSYYSWVWVSVPGGSSVGPVGPVLGTASTYTFTPDIVGTYTINLEINPTTDTDADAVIAAAAGGGPTSQGKSLQGGGLQGSNLEGDV
jgi:hypothetical protein